MQYILKVLLSFWMISSFQLAQAQVRDSSAIRDSINKAKQISAPAKIQEGPKKPPVNPNSETFRTPDEITLTIYFLLFGIFVLIIAAVLLYKFSNDCNIAFKYFIITLLILGMLLLIAIGLDKDQISPAVGLFGTIAGYLLGKTDGQTAPIIKKDDPK